MSCRGIFTPLNPSLDVALAMCLVMMLSTVEGLFSFLSSFLALTISMIAH